MEKISHRNVLIAIRVKRLKNGTVPITHPGESLQVLTYKKKAGGKTPAHFHKPKQRVTQSLQECLIMIKGRIKIDLYDGVNRKKFRSVYLSSGDIIIFTGGGHAVHVLEDTELIEVKNGPFTPDKVLIE